MLLKTESEPCRHSLEGEEVVEVEKFAVRQNVFLSLSQLHVDSFLGNPKDEKRIKDLRIIGSPYTCRHQEILLIFKRKAKKLF